MPTIDFELYCTNCGSEMSSKNRTKYHLQSIDLDVWCDYCNKEKLAMEIELEELREFKKDIERD